MLEHVLTRGLTCPGRSGAASTPTARLSSRSWKKLPERQRSKLLHQLYGSVVSLFTLKQEVIVCKENTGFYRSLHLELV